MQVVTTAEVRLKIGISGAIFGALWLYSGKKANADNRMHTILTSYLQQMAFPWPIQGRIPDPFSVYIEVPRCYKLTP